MPLQNICSQSDNFDNSFKFLNEKLSWLKFIQIHFLLFFKTQIVLFVRVLVSFFLSVVKGGVRTSKMMSVLGTSINSICARDLWC